MKFFYRVFKNGKIEHGKIEAESEKKVVDFLKSKNYLILAVDKDTNFFDAIKNNLIRNVSFNEVVNFTRQLAIMLNAGLNIVDAFDIFKKEIANPNFLKIINDIDENIKAGNNLSYALNQYPHVFNSLYVSLIKAGEKSGQLDKILLNLSNDLEKKREFSSKIKGAMIYPLVIIITIIIVMFVMITFIIPQLLNLFKEMNLNLPWQTQLIMSISFFCQKYWPFIISFSFIFFQFLRKWLTSQKGKLFFDKMILKIPVFSNVIKMAALVDMTRTLSLLIHAGVSILESLEIIQNTSSNVLFQHALKNIYAKVEKGQALGRSFAEEEIFPPILVQMITVGEETGNLDDTLARISHYFEMESEIAIKSLTSLIEPAILIILGLAVGFLATAIINPIYQITGSIK